LELLGGLGKLQRREKETVRKQEHQKADKRGEKKNEKKKRKKKKKN